MRQTSHTIAVLLLSILFSLCAHAGTGRPSSHPAGYGGGGRFTAIATDPTDPKHVYIGSDVAGIFRSRDGGSSFTAAGKGLESFAVADIAVNPAPPYQLVALTGSGLYYSPNRGDEWIRITDVTRYPSTYFGSRLLFFTRNSLWIGTDSKGVFQLPLNDPKAVPLPVPGLEQIKVNGLAQYDGYLYAATSRGAYRLEGKSWKPQNQGLPHPSPEITDIASSGNSLYMVDKLRGLFRWNPSALSWEGRPVTLPSKPRQYKSLLVHPNNPDLLFVSSHPEEWPHLLLKTQDAGSTWKSVLSFRLDPEAPSTQVTALTGIEEMAFVPGTSQSLFLADWWNLWHSSDGGDHWQQRHRGLQNTCLNDVKVHPRNPKTLFLCAWDNGLMTSDDSGVHWRRTMNGVVKDGHAQEIEISSKDPSRMVLLVNNGRGKQGRIHVYESRDAGLRWRDIGFSVPTETLPKQGFVDGLATGLELDPFSEETIYVATNGYGVYKTTNAGKSWSPANQGLTTPFIKGPGALLVHPRLPGTLLASTQAGGIYRSTDGAASWRRVTSGDRFTFGMAIDPSKPARIVAGGGGNTLLLSNDDGKTWRESRLPVTAHPQMAVYSVAFHPSRPGVVLAGTLRYDTLATEGFFISTDGGITFRPIPMDVPRTSATVLTAVGGEPASFYAGFVGTGLFRLELGEKP